MQLVKLQASRGKWRKLARSRQAQLEARSMAQMRTRLAQQEAELDAARCRLAQWEAYGAGAAAEQQVAELTTQLQHAEARAEVQAAAVAQARKTLARQRRRTRDEQAEAEDLRRQLAATQKALTTTQDKLHTERRTSEALVEVCEGMHNQCWLPSARLLADYKKKLQMMG